MVDCGDSAYQAVEYLGLADLQNVQILRAQIDSINAEQNTAGITLLDECVAASGLDLDNVEFYYHCEDSTGTIEDLARGHKAFAVDDIVYLMLAPPADGIPLRFYIVGHVDIRGTRICSSSEFLIISTLGLGNPLSWVTIYDVGNNSKLDLATFKAADPELIPTPPQPPEVIPALWTTSLQEWLDYYFRSSIPRDGVELTSSSFAPSFTIELESEKVMEVVVPPTGVGINYAISEEVYSSPDSSDYHHAFGSVNNYFTQEYRDGTYHNYWQDMRNDQYSNLEINFRTLRLTDTVTAEVMDYQFIRSDAVNNYFWSVGNSGDPDRYVGELQVPVGCEGGYIFGSAEMSFRKKYGETVTDRNQLYSYQHEGIARGGFSPVGTLVYSVTYSRITEVVVVGELGIYVVASSKGDRSLFSDIPLRDDGGWTGYPFRGYEDASISLYVERWTPDGSDAVFIPHPVVSLYTEAEELLAEEETLTAMDCLKTHSSSKSSGLAQVMQEVDNVNCAALGSNSPTRPMPTYASAYMLKEFE